MEGWGVEYANSPQWKEKWDATQNPQGEWPENVRLQGDKLIFKGKICVPETKVEELIEEFHRSLGHIGIQKLEKELGRRYVFQQVRTFLKSVGKFGLGVLLAKLVTPRIGRLPSQLRAHPSRIV